MECSLWSCRFLPAAALGWGSCSLTAYRITPQGFQWGKSNKDGVAALGSDFAGVTVDDWNELKRGLPGFVSEAALGFSENHQLKTKEINSCDHFYRILEKPHCSGWKSLTMEPTNKEILRQDMICRDTHLVRKLTTDDPIEIQLDTEHSRTQYCHSTIQ